MTEEFHCKWYPRVKMAEMVMRFICWSLVSYATLAYYIFR